MKLEKVGDKLRVIADEPYVSIADQINAAVMAERERCAKIAKRESRHDFGGYCDRIEEAIRNGETP